MSFTSRDLRGWFHTFTSLPLVHTLNPDFWDDIFDLASPWSPNLLFTKISAHCSSRSSRIPGSRTSQVPGSRASQVPGSKASQVLGSIPSQVPIILKWIADSREEARFGYHFLSLLENLKNTWNSSGSLHEFFAFLKLEFSSQGWFTNLYHEFWQTRRFEGVRFFPKSPTLAPRGSVLTQMIRFHENSWILVKNVTLGTSEWTHVLRITRNSHIEAVSWNYPPRPYK
jgi:hypothetical protein